MWIICEPHHVGVCLAFVDIYASPLHNSDRFGLNVRIPMLNYDENIEHVSWPLVPGLTYICAKLYYVSSASEARL